MEEKKRKLLVIDDELTNRKVLEGLLRLMGHEAVLAASGPEGLEIIKKDKDIALVLLDIMMPLMDGYEVAVKIREEFSPTELPVIMVTALSSKSDRIKAVEAGANDFINKPIEQLELKVRLASMLRLKEADDASKSYQAMIEEQVRVRTAALNMAMENLAAQQKSTKAAYLDTLDRLALAAEYRDDDTYQHIQRVGALTSYMALKLGMSAAEAEIVRYASLMHDVGKIGIPDSILLKPGRLSEEEWVVMRQHTVIGARILDHSSSELLQAGSTVALNHHERWDGKGYPNGIAGESIPILGRLCMVVDVFDAIRSVRPYKPAMPLPKALEVLNEGSGTMFDPGLINLFIENIDEIESLWEQTYPELDLQGKVHVSDFQQV